MEKVFVEINGLRQGMFIQEENKDNPVLLYLHGGPGSPEGGFTDAYPTGLDKIFTVCWWEQRGAGISYSSKIKNETMNFEQFIDDTVAVTEYLKKKYNKEKIYVMGHSWGTYLGMFTVQKHPELYYAYMGIGQISNQDKSERLAYNFMLEEFKKQNNTKMVKAFSKYNLNNGEKIPMMYMRIRSDGMMKLGIGIMHNLDSMNKAVKAVLHFKGYTLGDKFKFAMGSNYSLKFMWDMVTNTDMYSKIQELEIPVYVFQGKYDYQVSYQLAKEYIAKIKAPVKGFYTFENSAHSPCFEEPEKMCEIIKTDVLNNQTTLADSLN